MKDEKKCLAISEQNKNKTNIVKLPCFFDNHMTFWAIWVKALIFRPFGANTFVAQRIGLMTIWTACTLKK